MPELPGKFGNRLVFYVGEEPAYEPYSRSRGMISSNSHMDMTDYRAFGLSPGIKLVGNSKSTTNGVLVEHDVSRIQRLTVAEHGFDDTDEVFHPDAFPQFRLGSIETRFPLMDVAFCQLDEGVTYSNSTYFAAQPPKKMMATSYVDEHVSAAS